MYTRKSRHSDSHFGRLWLIKAKELSAVFLIIGQNENRMRQDGADSERATDGQSMLNKTRIIKALAVNRVNIPSARAKRQDGADCERARDGQSVPTKLA